MPDPRPVAVVTGSSSGVGAATAGLLAGEGWDVAVTWASNEEGARETEAACRKAGADVLVRRLDVSVDDECRALAGAAVERWGRIDALVNNAGTTKFCAHDDLEGLSKEDFLHIYSVNAVGPYQMIRAAAPALREGEGGSVVNVASVAGITGYGSSVAYAASKGALVTMTLSLARALGPEIRVNAVCPGFIRGDWLREGLGDERYERVREEREVGAPLQRTATPETVAEGIAFFLGRRSGIVTGETLILDGGHHLGTAPLTRR